MDKDKITIYVNRYSTCNVYMDMLNPDYVYVRDSIKQGDKYIITTDHIKFDDYKDKGLLATIPNTENNDLVAKFIIEYIKPKLLQIIPDANRYIPIIQALIKKKSLHNVRTNRYIILKYGFIDNVTDLIHCCTYELSIDWLRYNDEINELQKVCDSMEYRYAF